MEEKTECDCGGMYSKQILLREGKGRQEAEGELGMPLATCMIPEEASMCCLGMGKEQTEGERLTVTYVLYDGQSL